MKIMDWITFGIAVIGFCVSIYNFIETRIYNAKHLDVKVKYTFKTSGVLLIVVEFVNKSRLNISVTSGSFNGEHTFGEISTMFFTYKDQSKAEKVSEHTKKFPIKIEPLSAVTVLMETDAWNPELPKSYEILLGTSRGFIRRSIEMPLNFDDWKCLLKRLK